ncbi:MAG: ATP-binding cassette domain-containing protein [Lactobacillales bacterium]|nr:ATP-binding cassette domain-containing protein [Lactobacillales bacterium]
MLKVSNLALKFGTRTLFENVNIEFNEYNCYGIIGANGAGKSTFLKILSGEIESTKGEVIIGKGERISVLKQNHNEFDSYTVMETVLGGDEELYSIMKEKEAIYMKADFSMEDGIRAGELEARFEEKNGWQAESDAAIILAGLGITNDYFEKNMSELKDKDKVKVLLARALFGEPDILLLDEPTNGLDMTSKIWLEEFLINFKNTVLVISHDRHFLNKVCTHMVDIDYSKITLFVGNYDFWYKSSKLIQQQMLDSNKRKEEKIKELQDFIARFSANASKSKQATSRKKSLEKIVLDEIKPSSRKYPYINFEIDKKLNKEVIALEKINYSIDSKTIIKDLNLTLRKDDKIVLVGENEIAKTALLNIIAGVIKPDSGTIKIGSNVKISYFPKNHDSYFENDENMIEWLNKYSDNNEESFIRGFLGRMLFSKEETLKKVSVLSGGEKVRCMLSKMMLEKGNVLLLDEPTNHLDIESITSLNDGMTKYDSAIIFSTYDLELIESVSNRIIEIKEDGTYIDKQMSYEEYLEKFKS